MNANEIITIVQQHNAPLSAKGIAHYAGVDADSGMLRDIQATCWELVESGHFSEIDRREEKNGGLFFQSQASI